MAEQGGMAPLAAILSQYQKVRPDYQLLAEYLQKRLSELALSLGMYPIVMGRAKSLESLAEKIQRKGEKYRDPLREITDLCGVRVITHTLDQVELLTDVVKKEFVIDPINSEDKKEKLAFREFGYLSSHFVIQLKEVPQIAGCSEEGCRRLKDLKAELQLRTMAQHLWADVYHELGYKNEFQLPGRWEREFARLAALLEDCDKGFQDIKNAMEVYQSSYGSYMTQDQLKTLATRLQSLLVVDSDNVWAMHRLIRTYLSIEGSDERLREVLQKYRDTLQSYAPALRDIGVAYTQVYRGNPTSGEFLDGQEFLKKAIALDPRDIDSWCSLGGTYRKQGDHEEALRCYREAFYLDPTNPYPLGNYVAELLLTRSDAEVIQYFRPHIQAAAERCRTQVEVKVNLPWALFDLGIFHLYLGDPYAGLCSYAKGTEVAPRAWMVQSAAKTIDSFLRAAIPLDGLEWLDKLLCIGWWARATDKEKRASAGMVTQEPVKFTYPVLILAGGCDGLDTAAMPQLDVLKEHLAGVRGTIVCGGTRSGVAAIPGGLQERFENERRSGQRRMRQLQTIGYLPARDAVSVRSRIDTRYSHQRHTTGKDFSPLEPLTFWEDFLASGGDPTAVKLLGFNGGKIAACEFRIALAFGARVGIIAGSGRAADEMLADVLWKDHPCLHPLTLDGDDVKNFLSPRTRLASEP